MRGGWVQGLADGLEGKYEVVNKSIGSTGVLNVIQQIIKLGDRVEDFDFILLDHFINDVHFFLGAKDRYFFLINQVYKYLNQLGIPFLIVAFSRRNLDHSSQVFLGEIFTFLNENNIFFYDVSKRLEAMNSSESGDLSQLYQDSAHPYPYVSYRIGVDLASNLESYGAKCFHDDGGEKFKFCSIDVDSLMGCSGFDDNSIVDIKNSLISYKLIALRDGVFLSWEIPPELRGGELVGMVFNATSAIGFFNLETAGLKLTKSISNAYSGKIAPIIWARPIHKKIVLGDKLLVWVNGNASCFEKTEFCDVDLAFENRCGIELFSLIVLARD